MIHFKSFGAETASGRYRAAIPAKVIGKLGFDTEERWLIIGKHSWDWDEETRNYDRVCFDVCDDHLSDYLKDHYRACIDKADLVTCNSAFMASLIRQETGKEPFVIPDPYEQREEPPRCHDRLLWFGFKNNLKDLAPYGPKLKNLEVVTNLEVNGFTLWSPEAMDLAFSRAGLVILPTGRSMAKSGNRAIESIRRGLFVVAGYLPAYADLGIYIGDIFDGVEWALSHKMEVLKRVKAAQEYVRIEYSPERIGRLWIEAIWQSRTMVISEPR